MMIDPVDEQIKLLSKQLKTPTFTSYTTVLRQAGNNATFNQLLLGLMKREYDQPSVFRVDIPL